MGMAAPVYYSAEMVRTLPDDGNRYETVHGELLVTPAPRAWHQEVLDRLRAVTREYLKRHPIGHQFSAPADISWSDDTLVQPDLFVVDIEQARTMDWREMKNLLLVIEVLSPTTARPLRPIYKASSLPRSERSRVLDRGPGAEGGRGVDTGGAVSAGGARAYGVDTVRKRRAANDRIAGVVCPALVGPVCARRPSQTQRVDPVLRSPPDLVGSRVSR